MKLKSKTKTLISAVAIAVLCCTLLGWLTSGFQNFNFKEKFEKERNAANLIELDDVTLKTCKHASGLEFEVDENGVVIINGTTDEDVTIAYATVALEQGDYVLTGADGSKSTYYLSTTNNGTTVMGDFPGTFTVTAEGTFTVNIVIKANFECKNVKIYPVLNTGSEAVEFFK